MGKQNFPVWFNKDAYDQWQKLKKINLTSQQFKDFVKTAFHEKITQVRNNETSE